MARSVPYCDFDSPTYIYQPEKAASLLEEEGWLLPAGKTVREKQGKPLQLLLSYNVNNAVEKEIAELLQDDFKKIGVALTVLGEEKQAF